MSTEQLKSIIDEGELEWELLVAQSGCDSDKVIQLLDTQSYFDLLHQPYPTSRDAVLRRFESERLICRDGGSWAIANLGAVLFAKNLGRFDRLSLRAPRVIVYEGKDKSRTRTDQAGIRGYAVGFQGLVEYINGLIPTNEVIEQALRREVKMFPEIAVRELVANALIHQDFRETGSRVMIEMFCDRMEISSPGAPFISPERFIDEYRTRNERLADLMRRLGVCEARGSGFDNVVRASELFELPAPDIRVGDRKTTVVLFSHQNIDEMNRNDRIRACYQHCVLRYVKNERMTNQSLRDRFKLPESKSPTVSQIITATLEAQKIKVADPSQTSTRYRRYLPFWA